MNKSEHSNSAIFKCLKNCAHWRLNTPYWQPESDLCEDALYEQWLRSGNSESHDNLELFIALSGHTCYGYNHELRQCRPGDVFLVERKIPHARGFPKHLGEFEHVWFWISPLALFSFLICKDVNKPFRKRISCNEENFCSWIFSALLGLRDEQLSLELRRRQLIGITHILLNWYLLSMEKQAEGHIFITSSINKSKFDRERELVANSCDYIQQKSGRGITVARLAALANYSKYHFSRIFKRHTNMTILEYIDKVRLNYAMALEQSGCRSKQIAEKLGFSSDAVYRRWRRKYLNQHAAKIKQT